MTFSMIQQVRDNQPIVLNVANSVTPQLVANAIAYIGASPIMLEDPLDAADLTQIANVVTLNLGSTSENVQQVMINAGKTANQLGIPVVFDPVAVGATPLRHQRAQELLEKVDVAIVRGNLGEVATLAGFDWNGHGIDAGSGSSDPVAIVQEAAQRLNAVVVATGVADLISDGTAVYRVENSAKMLATNVGMGDALDGLLGAFASQSMDLADLAYATAALPVAGELALADGVAGPADFLNKMLDHLANLTDEELQGQIKFNQL
ncbi:hydroxyethylthiazole kinase [Fructobacillus pseudoficulneus]|uniref:Hydroxyethylthiazole kinase n=1 Tax=Fructobacillus pseudoficulneus TaxID=220714 RepID=A0A3F3GSL8_9LACO|nr:hydroxyethylthiazole kinase [Fructobacillus pseudoficulneus]GAP02566.1 hydroxyethylthiazole kinase [Fructobacillus pseudoficulneus]SEH38247.1 hydroxyethylthiazole kinase [Fructobacillus pseudoficulneus]